MRYPLSHQQQGQVSLRLYNVEYIDWIELQSATVKHTQINDFPGSEIEFDILVKAEETYKIRDKRNLVHAKLCLKRSAEINDDLCKVVVAVCSGHVSDDRQWRF